VFAQFNLGLMYHSGFGVPQDYVRAHMWYNLSTASISREDRPKAQQFREALAAKMTAAQIEQAQEMARRCLERNYKGCD
jgi:uncharacterized protein